MAQPLRRKSSKREVILIRAATMFKDKGFAASSMRDLAETVGIEAASLYNHIKSKSEILQEIIFHAAAECNLQLDEVDAGVVYKTDVTPEIAQDVTTVEIPDVLNVIAIYPIALTTNGQAQAKDAAQAFISFVLSDAGQAILMSHGFLEAQ